MPRYVYRCAFCDKTFNVFHPMGETMRSCEECGESVERVPSTQYTFSSSKKIDEDVGTRVERHIDDAKKELEKTKRQSTEEYK